MPSKNIVIFFRPDIIECVNRRKKDGFIRVVNPLLQKYLNQPELFRAQAPWDFSVMMEAVKTENPDCKWIRIPVPDNEDGFDNPGYFTSASKRKRKKKAILSV